MAINKEFLALCKKAQSEGIAVGTTPFWKVVSKTYSIKNTDVEIEERGDFHVVKFDDFAFNVAGKPKSVYTGALCEASREYGNIAEGEQRVRVF